MRDVTGSVRTSVVQKLRNNVTVGGNIVKVYARVPSVNNPGNYIYVPTQSTQNNSAKQYDSADHSIDIECVYTSEDGTDINPLEAMTDKVMQILDVKNMNDMPLPAGFGLVDFEFVRRTDLTDYGDSETIHRAVLTFEFLIDE